MTAKRPVSNPSLATPVELSSSGSPQSVARGAALMLGFKLVERGIGFISVLILARLLTPADFGLVAMATSVVALIELMGAFGFDSALIQRNDAKRPHFDTAWTFQVLFGVASAVLLLVLALPAGDFYRDPRISLMLPALAVGALAQGFENIGPVMFRKSLDFKSEFIFLLSKRLAGFLVTIAMALVFRNFWALVAGTVTGRIATTVMSYAIHTYRPRFSLAARADLLHFTKWLFISNLLNFAQQNADKFILGRTIGAQPLGLYNIASEIAALPSTALIAPINRAVYPVYARLASDIAALRVQFLAVFGQIALIAFPVSIGIASASDVIVRVLLGDQWLDAIPLLRLLIISGLVGALVGNLFSVIVALGQPKAATLVTAGMLPLHLPLLAIFSLRFGSVGAAWVQLGMSVLLLVPLHIIFFRLTNLGRTEYVSRLWRPALASIGMGGLMTAAHSLECFSSFSIWFQLLGFTAIGTVTYALCLLLLWVLAGRPIYSAEVALITRLKSLRTMIFA